MKETGKRMRVSAELKVSEPQHSTSLADGTGERSTLEDDLPFKLQTLQDMLSSTRPVSVLHLRGEELDDSDAHLVSLPDDLSLPAESDGTYESYGDDDDNDDEHDGGYAENDADEEECQPEPFRGLVQPNERPMAHK